MRKWTPSDVATILSKSAWTVVSETKYVWAGWLMLMELDGLSSDAVLRRNTWGLDLAGQAGSVGVPPASLQSAGGIGGLLAVCDANGTPGNPNDDLAYVYFYDANGNVGQVFDPATQAVVAHYEYDPFGNVTNDLSGYAYAETNRWRFSTKQFDAATGLGYWGYRYYDPVLGRWLNRDPIGEAGGVNLYAYVENEPAGGIDPWGLFQCERVIDVAPTVAAKNAAFQWLRNSWDLQAAYVTNVTAGSGAVIGGSMADTWTAAWIRPFTELFKCCVPGKGVQYLWSQVNWAQTWTHGRISNPANAFPVTHITGGTAIPGTPASMPLVTAYYVNVTTEGATTLETLAKQKPPRRNAAITWPWPRRGPRGMSKLVDHIPCDPNGATAWPGSTPANQPPVAPRVTPWIF